MLDVQKYVEKGASKGKIGLRGAMPRSLSVPWHIIERSGHGICLCNKR